jgi:multicomponent Na+:H+ antiporter subunit G
MVLGGLMAQSPSTLVTIKLGLILFFIFFTSPTSTHALVKAALISGVRPVVSNKGSGKKSLAPVRDLAETDKASAADGPSGATKGEPSS